MDPEGQLVFSLTAIDRPWPIALYPSLTPPHFALFALDGEESRELNYGQGEGQFTIRDREWGVYVSRSGISLVAHDPAVTAREAIEIVEAICAKLERIGGEHDALDWSRRRCEIIRRIEHEVEFDGRIGADEFSADECASLPYDSDLSASVAISGIRRTAARWPSREWKKRSASRERRWRRRTPDSAALLRDGTGRAADMLAARATSSPTPRGGRKRSPTQLSRCVRRRLRSAVVDLE